MDRLVQFNTPELGPRLGYVDGDRILDLAAAEPAFNNFMALMEWAGGMAEEVAKYARETAERVPDELHNVYDWQELDRPPAGNRSFLTIPLAPPEVWGFGVTYRRSAEVRDADVAAAMDSSASIYDRVYHSDRPECFFKATAARCAGPYEPIGIRSDSELTATEPELAYILGKEREIVGYTICNDVSAWDIERENPLYLPQSKIYSGCCALGPTILLAASGPDPYDLEISCRIIRDRETIYEESTSSGRIGRKLEELNEYLCRDNPVPPGTVVSTGTGIMVPNEFALKDGDTVEIEIAGIGTLSNPVKQL